MSTLHSRMFNTAAQQRRIIEAQRNEIAAAGREPTPKQEQLWALWLDKAEREDKRVAALPVPSKPTASRASSTGTDDLDARLDRLGESIGAGDASLDDMLAEARELSGRYPTSATVQRYHTAVARAAAIDQHGHPTAQMREQRVQLIAHARTMRAELREAGLCQ